MNSTNPMTARIQVFLWREKDGTEHRWSVDMALAYIMASGKRPDLEIDRALATEAYNKNEWIKDLKPENVIKACMDEPLIICETVMGPERNEGHVIIDGWHRIKKFVESNRQEPLIAWYLDRHEAQRIKIQ